jgi:mRNA-degrading endonuclease RelE of RelBE toxin-antitoxin system
LTISSAKRTLQRTKRFSRDIKKLPLVVQQDAYEVAQKLMIDVFNSELDIKALLGFKNIYRVIVLNNYRMIFSFDAHAVYLLRIAHRKDIYRHLEL